MSNQKCVIVATRITRNSIGRTHDGHRNYPGLQMLCAEKCLPGKKAVKLARKLTIAQKMHQISAPGTRCVFIAKRMIGARLPLDYSVNITSPLFPINVLIFFQLIQYRMRPRQFVAHQCLLRAPVLVFSQVSFIFLIEKSCTMQHNIQRFTTPPHWPHPQLPLSKKLVIAVWKALLLTWALLSFSCSIAPWMSSNSLRISSFS